MPSGRRVRAGAWSQELKQRPWSNATIGLLLRSFFYAIQDHLPGDGTTHSDLGLPSSIRKMSTDLPEANMIKAYSQVQLCLPR